MEGQRNLSSIFEHLAFAGQLTSQFFRGIHLQLLEDVLGTGELEVVHRRLTSSVGDLAVVEDNGVTSSTALVESPADAAGELGLGVGEEELQQLVHNAQFKFFCPPRKYVQCHRS